MDESCENCTFWVEETTIFMSLPSGFSVTCLKCGEVVAAEPLEESERDKTTV